MAKISRTIEITLTGTVEAWEFCCKYIEGFPDKDNPCGSELLRRLAVITELLERGYPHFSK